MFGSQILDVIIGLILVFILVSVICSAVREGIEAFLKTRASYLEYGIRSLLHDSTGTGLAQKLYNHPLVEGLFSGDYLSGNAVTAGSVRGRNLPSYIPSKNFAEALLDIAARGPNTDAEVVSPFASTMTVETIRKNIENIDNPRVQRVLLIALDEGKGDLERVKKNLEAWYDSGMDRVSGWYKRSTQWVLLAIGLVVAITLNINALTIIDFLSKNEAARDVAVAHATRLDNTGKLPNNEEAKQQLKDLSLPIGWSTGPEPIAWTDLTLWKILNIFASGIIGWLIVAFAATMGAPFWFDLLNKFMVIRSTVKPNEKSPPEGSEDRQLPEAKPAEPPPAAPPPPNGGAPPAQPDGTSPTAPTAPPSPPAPPAPPPSELASPLPEWESMPGSDDPEREFDGCTLATEDDELTGDEILPEAEGGVA